jgi:hypothetical protein
MRLKLDEVPQDLRRRVAQRLESLRDTDLGEGAQEAQLGGEVCPIYRPDIKDVAYWEFEIVGLKTTAARDRKSEGPNDSAGGGVGFMLAAAGRHDIPLSHWSLSIEPPSRALEAKAKAAGGEVVRIVKLDTLAYAAEDAKGNYLAHVGQFPPLISGMGTSAKTQQGISTVTALPGQASKNDEDAGKLTVTSSGAALPKVKLAAWRSWADAKRRYAAVYKPHLAALVAHAATHWEIEDLLEKYGEGILAGNSLTVPLLKPGKARLAGEGEKFVKLTPLGGKPGAVRLQTEAVESKAEVSFQLNLSYEDGTQEVLNYFVVPKGAPSNFRSLPSQR